MTKPTEMAESSGILVIPVIQGLEQWPVSVAMRESFWLYPTIESLHIAGVAGLFGSIFLLDLRMLGLGAALGVSALTRFILPVAFLAFGLLAVSGSLMFIAHPQALLTSPLFIYKLGFIALLACNAALLHLREPMTNRQGYAPALRGISRIQVVLSISGWLAVIALGRWLAYV